MNRNRHADDEWDSQDQKFSHSNKSLEKHIKEMKEDLEKLLNFYDIDTWVIGRLSTNLIKEIGYFLSEYHDKGKLHREWSVENEKRVRHSEKSLEWLYEVGGGKFYFEPFRRYSPILHYLILKHHGKLSRQISFRSKNEDLQEYVNNFFKGGALELIRLLKELEFEDRINIIDVFGLFKICDVASSEDKRFSIIYEASDQMSDTFIPLKRPKFSEKLIRNLLGDKIDEERWKQQLRLKDLPDIGLLRAYTGWGKSDTSFLFFINKNVSKIFYILPTITAINNFYDKLKSIMGDKDIIKYFYFYDAEVVDESYDRLYNMFYVRNFIGYPCIITTIDQILLSFLQLNKYYLRRPMMRHSGLIIDEVHLLAPLLLELLIYFINKFKNIYKIRALLMSATLSRGLKEYIMTKLDIPEHSYLDYSNGYKERRRIMYTLENSSLVDSIGEIVEKYEKVNKDGVNKKFLVITNTVEEAIKIAEQMHQYVPEDELILLHSRFMHKDRRRIEKALFNKYLQKSHIFISTQVSEVSLDISYDELYTELAPLPSLIQRFGRVNRRGKITYTTNIHIYNKLTFEGSNYPYPTEELKIAEEILSKYSGDRLESEFELISELDKICNKDYIEELVSKELNRVNIKAFEEFLLFFFSLDIAEDELKEILEYRDSFTTLIIPSPDLVEDEKTKKILEDAINKGLKELSFKERQRFFAEIKNYTIPVPIYWLRGTGIDEYRLGFPIIKFKDKKYDKIFGLINVRDEVII